MDFLQSLLVGVFSSFYYGTGACHKMGIQLCVLDVIDHAPQLPGLGCCSSIAGL